MSVRLGPVRVRGALPERADGGNRGRAGPEGGACIAGLRGKVHLLTSPALLAESIDSDRAGAPSKWVRRSGLERVLFLPPTGHKQHATGEERDRAGRCERPHQLPTCSGERTLRSRCFRCHGNVGRRVLIRDRLS